MGAIATLREDVHLGSRAHGNLIFAIAQPINGLLREPRRCEKQKPGITDYLYWYKMP